MPSATRAGKNQDTQRPEGKIWGTSNEDRISVGLKHVYECNPLPISFVNNLYPQQASCLLVFEINLLWVPLSPAKISLFGA